MTDDTLETVDGYTEERQPDTLVLVRRTGNRYHEVGENGDVACGVKIDREDLDEVTLKHAVYNWYEPCECHHCERRREERRDVEKTKMRNDYPEYQPDTLFFGNSGYDDKDQLERAYWGYYWSICEIADWTGRSNSTVRHVMLDHDIPIRDCGEASQISYMKDDGVDLERIAQEYPHPERERSKENADRVNWSDAEQ